MFWCPRCKRDKDTFCFPRFHAGQVGKLCKSCLATIEKVPNITHWEQRKWNNAGFQKETPAQIESRRKMIALDNQFNFR